LKSFLKRSQESGVRSQNFAIAIVVIICGVVGLRAELTEWAANTEAGSKIEAALFRLVPMPTGSIAVRRPPKETRPELTKLITAAPKDAELLSLRALEEEQQLDFVAAEKDWLQCIDLSKDHMAARVALADFYHRRARSAFEFEQLGYAAMDIAPESEKLLPDSQQRAWKLFERAVKLVDEQQLDPGPGATVYGNWVARYPKDSQLYVAAFQYTIAHGLYEISDQVIRTYQSAFPNEEAFPIEARAEVTAKIGTVPQALAVYENSFRPLWPERLVTQYFALLKQTNSLRVYLDKARAGVAANPTDLASAVKLFYYWQQQNNLPAAERALAEFRQRKDSRKSAWTSDELLTLGRLYEAVHDYDEAARNYYAMYSATSTNGAVSEAAAENALSSLARMILTAPEQPMHFGSGNLSLYRDVATMDPHPGFLNGVLSLLLNNTDPANRAALEEQNAAPYFRRARGAELVALFESRFPNSTQRADLRERVIEAYAIYGSNDGVIRAGTKFLTDFADAPNRTAVALRVGDAYARTNQAQREFAIYDSLLAELGKRAGSVPLGALPPPKPASAPIAGAPAASPEKTYESVRSPEYARVLDRYVARLVSLKRTRDALAIYRREIDRNPNDPGLYDVLAAFLEQNKLGAEMEQTYQRAIAQFPDHTWEHKLARWYLRQRRTADVAKITQDVVKTFSGTELDGFFKDIVHSAAPVGPALYLQLNTFAHQRFPHHLSFVRNLLGAYSTTPTRDDAAYMKLLREHWLDADDLRMRFFERVSRAGRLGAELAGVRAANPAFNQAAAAGRWAQAEDQNPAAVRMLAEGEAWRCHFEAAAPIFLAIENDYPADASVGARTVAIYRSLGTIDPKFTDTAIAAGAKLADANPRNAQTLTRLGEMEADRDKFDNAVKYWDRIPRIEPGKADSYLEAATIYWDYYRYDDAIRTLEEARKRLRSPALFAYENGAILENQHEYARAIREYAKGALAQTGPSGQSSGGQGSGAERRLIALGRRPELRTDVDQLTDNLSSSRDPSFAQFRLRAALLRNQGRRADLENFMMAVAGRATSPELLAAIENEGRIEEFARVEETALQRQIATTTDPVDKIRLRVSMMRFYEGHQQARLAAREIDAVYRDNPAILGVVRTAVDFHWRTKNQKRAIDVLEESAGRADAGYRAQFTLEAARKSIESGNYPRAAGFATKLLSTEPYRAEYIAVMADTFARSGDDRGLRGFYDAKIRELQSAQLSTTQKTEQIAAMRRALIPVLTRTKDFTAALDQYIEVLNRFPEDESLAREAAAYASANGVAQRLRDYYTKATNDSPKDFRWPMVMAKVETQMENFPAAIAAYTLAAGVRPDRADLLVGRLNLEERLLRFDEAGATTEKLYDLTYRNPDWMVKLAEIRARQGRTADAIAALQKAWTEGRRPSARTYFDIAEKLERWGALADARKFAEQGMKLVTADNRDELTTNIQMYARVLAKLRAYPVASPDVIATGAPQIAAVAGQYYSPDEKVKYSAWVQARLPGANRLALVQGAGIADVEAKMRAAALMAQPDGANALANLQALIQLQKQRLAFDELGSQLEAYDRALPPSSEHKGELTEAAQAYRASGNTAAEYRVLQGENNRNTLSGVLIERYAQLVVGQQQRLTTVLSRETGATNENAVVNYAMEHSTVAVAHQAIALKGRRAGPQWTNAYTALAGLYFASNAAPVKAAFPALLGEMTIGSRIGKPLDRTKQLAGEPWFYYGGRYGEYLGTMKQAGADDYLPSIVEATPQQSQPYFELAEYFRNAGDAAAATADYRNALELNANRADAHDRLALIAAKAGRRDEAVSEWRAAIAALNDTLNRGAAPPRFWTDASDVLHHVGDAKLLAPLREDLDKLLRAYVHRNGTYHVDELLEGVIAGSADAAAGVAWIVEISRTAPDATQFLGYVVDRPWLPEAQKSALYRRIVESAQAKVAASYGEQRGFSQNELWRWQTAQAKYLEEHGESARAAEILAELPEEWQKHDDVVALQIRAAAAVDKSGAKLAALLAKYGDVARMSAVRYAGAELMKSDAASARRVLEFVYRHELDAGKFDAANFLGLAEILIEERNVPGAVLLLRRATLVSGAAFATLDSAAALLEKTGHVADAVPFLADLVKAEPWNWDARERLAVAQGAPDALTVVAKSGEALYANRAAAALALRGLKAAALAGTDSELMLLSSQAVLTDAVVAKPYYAVSRWEAASSMTATPASAAACVKLIAGAIAIDPRAEGQKLALFRAALEARQDALAVAVAGQILPAYLFEGQAEAQGDVHSNDAELSPWIADQFASNLPMADRVAMARGLGDAEQRLGESRAALFAYQVANRLEPADRIRRAIETIRTQKEIDAKNNARRPMVTDNLDQDRLVHARVTR
jgi:cellulose synthase operon protein C